MSIRALELGIKAVQRGSLNEGARLLRYALKGTLDGDQRATGYIWLAETTVDPGFKRACYAQAVAAARDPGLSADARSRLASIPGGASLPTAADIPTSGSTPIPAPPARGGTGPLNPTPGMPGSMPGAAGGVRTRGSTGTLVPPNDQPAPPASAQGAPVANANVALYVARVLDGPNGVGTAFYYDGMWVTTRRVVGGLERVTLELHQRGQMIGAVVRSIPEQDIALLHLEYAPPGAPASLPAATLTDGVETPLTAVAFDGTMTTGAVRPTQRRMSAHWIPTTFTHLPDAGGDPLFDAGRRLVGMITTNTARNADHYFGVTLAAVAAAISAYRRQSSVERQVYCPACGTRSRALAAGLFYCDVCGCVATTAQTAQRRPLPQGEPYYAPGGRACLTCGVAAGSHKGRCLRCGGRAV